MSVLHRVCSRLATTASMKFTARLLPRPVSMAQRMVQAKSRKNMQTTVRFYAAEAKWTNDALDDLIKDNKIVVFMKGTPLEPMCGFSKAVVTILQMHGIVEFHACNVLEDEELRQKVKDYSSWPTVPQVYIDGEFVGGCDIMIQLHQTGELIKELEKVGFRSILADEVD